MKNFKRYIAAALIGTTLTTPTFALAQTSTPTQAFSFETINFTKENLSVEDFKTLVENFMNEALSHEKDICDLRERLYNDRNFKFNQNELAKNVCSLVYVANYSHFTEDVRAQILGTYVPVDAMEIMMNMLSVTNIINSYNQITLRDQEITQKFDIDKLISYEDVFNVKVEKEEYIYARKTLFESVKNGRVYNTEFNIKANENLFIPEFEMLYDYFGKFLGGNGSHNIENAEFGAQTIINQTVGMDYLESIKVVFDELMQDGEFNKRIEHKMDKNFLKEVDELNKTTEGLTVADYFEDRVAYIPTIQAKEQLFNITGIINNYNSELQLVTENGVANYANFETSAENLIYRYIHVYDEVNNLNNIMKALGYSCNTNDTSKTR